MKQLSSILLLALTSIVLCAAAPPQNSDTGELAAVLKSMDTAAAHFTTTQAEFEWDRYEKVINEVDDVQAGTIYYRRAGNEIEMKADIKKIGDSPSTLKPEAKFVLFSKGAIRMYLPKADTVTVYDLGKNRSDFESYLVLGFGGSGQDLVKQWDVTYLGQESISGVATGKLQLVPKSQRLRNNLKQIILWIDLQRGISVQQQMFEPQGDYRLAKYSAIKVNEKISSDVFQLKTTGKTQTISPHS